MAESHEPSYYEIALTNRQVVVAFVILLICLLSAFFSGVWIGREGTARTAQEQVVRNTPPPASDEGKNLEELEFFDSRGKAGDGKPVTLPEEDAQEQTPASADTTLQEDLAGTGATAGEDAAAPAEKPAGERGPAARQAGTAPEADEDAAAEPDRNERRNRRNRNADRAAPAATPEPAIPKGSVVIQVFSSADRSQADRIRERLVGGGYQAYLSPVEVGGHTMFRVRIGPFGSRKDADQVAEKVRKGYKLDTWVTE
ncbi:MAG TPA: SPOR domain-containing protein [Thermoanaerobaculia bacterium]|nr:SPOR domain-containing protein [Thermoanaerobaculia bacterium]